MLVEEPGRNMPHGQAASRVKGGPRQHRLPPTVPGAPRSPQGTGHHADVPSDPYWVSAHLASCRATKAMPCPQDVSWPAGR